TLAATDRQGVVQTQGRQLTVNASNANGIRVAKVRFSTKNVLRRHSLRMTVTTKDRLGRLVVGARISVSATKRGFLAKRPQTVLLRLLRQQGRLRRPTPFVPCLRRRSVGKTGDEPLGHAAVALPRRTRAQFGIAGRNRHRDA